MVVVGVFQPFVLLNRRRVDQMYPVSRLHQAVDQPIQIVGRFHRQAFDAVLKGFQASQDIDQIAILFVPIHDSVVFVDQLRYYIR